MTRLPLADIPTLPFRPQCQFWSVAGARCQELATSWLLTPEETVFGPYCPAHADGAVAEYAAKLGETWHAEPIRIARPGGTP